MPNKTILLVEDDQAITDLLREHAAALGYKLDHAATGVHGLEKALAARYDLVILDLNLPGLGGLEILRAIRKRDEGCQVIVLTAKGSELDRVVGLELGADDYIIKPFSLAELTARIKARLREAEVTEGHRPVREAPRPSVAVHSSDAVIRFGDLEVHLDRRVVTRGGAPLDLTTLEYDLVAFMASRPGVAFSRDDLMQAVWGYSIEDYESNVNSTINRIRRKVEPDPQKPRYLLTVRGLGYKWCDLPAHDGE